MILLTLHTSTHCSRAALDIHVCTWTFTSAHGTQLTSFELTQANPALNINFMLGCRNGEQEHWQVVFGASKHLIASMYTTCTYMIQFRSQSSGCLDDMIMMHQLPSQVWSFEPSIFRVFYCTGWETTKLHYRRLIDGRPLTQVSVTGRHLL